MEKPLISVIIPAFNAASYISQCLECIFIQNFKDLEVIVVNDGSTDDTEKIVSGFPVKLINQENKGVSAARNAGLKVAQGKYIHFMDDDDLLNLGYYEKMFEIAEQTNADMVCSGLKHERLPSLSSCYSDCIVVSATEDKMRLTNVGNQGNCVKFLIKRDLLEKNQIRFDEDLQIGEDVVFAIKAVYWANKIATVPGATYHYKHRTQSAMTKKGSISHLQRRLKVREAKLRRTAFINEHKINVIGMPTHRDICYKILGFLPLVKKRIYDTGRIKWYFIGICIIHYRRFQ
ncbi:hypothetical protein MASR2M117_16510 [Paludibacter sp.]